jgi:hypothetical protein
MYWKIHTPCPGYGYQPTSPGGKIYKGKVKNLRAKEKEEK